MRAKAPSEFVEGRTAAHKPIVSHIHLPGEDGVCTWVTGAELMPVGFANSPGAKPATRTAAKRPATIFSESDILAFMTLLDQHARRDSAALAFRGSPRPIAMRPTGNGHQSIIPCRRASASANLRAWLA
jgi:hypothetical protein